MCTEVTDTHSQGKLEKKAARERKREREREREREKGRKKEREKEEDRETARGRGRRKDENQQALGTNSYVAPRTKHFITGMMEQLNISPNTTRPSTVNHIVLWNLQTLVYFTRKY